MKREVVFTGTGFDCSAYFERAIDCYTFAELMADAGRLCAVKADGVDITDEFCTFFKINYKEV